MKFSQLNLPALNDIFPVHSVGIVSARDSLTFRTTHEEMYATIKHFSKCPENEARKSYNLKEDTRDWTLTHAQQDIHSTRTDIKRIVPILCKPFETKYTYYTGKTRGFLTMPRPSVMSHMLQSNLALISTRPTTSKIKRTINTCFVSENIVNGRVSCTNGLAKVYPLYLYREDLSRSDNISTEYREILQQKLRLKKIPSAVDTFCYIYAIMFSPSYQNKYRVQLESGRSPVPYPGDRNSFIIMCEMGKRLIQLHVLKSGQLSQKITEIPASVLRYRICGYPVVEKAIKRLQEQESSFHAVQRLAKIISAIRMTIEIQDLIDIFYKKMVQRKK